MTNEPPVPNPETLPYRQGVIAFLVDSERKFFLVQKLAYGNNQWDMPGGGLGEGEDPDIGVLREVEEELGTSGFEIVCKSSRIYKYEWPQDQILKAHEKYGKWWRGQEKYQYLVRFTGNKDDIILPADELKQGKWVRYEKLQAHMVFDGQWEEAKRTIEEFEEKGLLKAK